VKSSERNETNDSTAVSDGNETNNPTMTGDTQHPHEPHIQILRGQPTDEELAALIAALATVTGAPAPAQPESTRWGLPVDKLRYAIFNYQRITLQQRIHMER
jgi:hypothetical protein